MSPEQLYGITQFAKAIGWDQRKAQVYYQRGKLPEPFAFNGNAPLWKPEQAEEFKRKLEETK
jgi:hypothetical protein